MTRVLVVDDHDFFRSCLLVLLASTRDLLAVGECRDGLEVLEAVRTLAPDVVLMDVRMPRRAGLEALGDLSASNLPEQAAVRRPDARDVPVLA
jgi:DNA-binding NarL/FixJ family response regulator